MELICDTRVHIVIGIRGGHNLGRHVFNQPVGTKEVHCVGSLHSGRGQNGLNVFVHLEIHLDVSLAPTLVPPRPNNTTPTNYSSLCGRVPAEDGNRFASRDNLGARYTSRRICTETNIMYKHDRLPIRQTQVGLAVPATFLLCPAALWANTILRAPLSGP